MIITDILAGTKPVTRVYIGTNLIWEKRKGDSLFGGVEIKSHTISRISYFTLITPHGYAESLSYGEAVANLEISGIVGVAGEEEIDTYAKAGMALFQRISHKGGEKHTSYGAATQRFYQRLHGSSEATSATNVEATMFFFERLHLVADSAVNVYTRGDGGAMSAELVNGVGTASADGAAIGNAFYRIAFAGDSNQEPFARGTGLRAGGIVTSGAAPAVTGGHAVGDAFIFMEYFGKTKSELITDSEASDFDANILHGGVAYKIFAEATGGSWDRIWLAGSGLSGSSGDSNGNDLQGIFPIGKSVTDTDGAALVELWPQLKMNSILEVHSKALAAMRYYRRFKARGKVKYASDALAIMEYLYNILSAGRSESAVETHGAMNPWYLPYNNNGILELRQAYEADFTDGILEVR